VRTVLLLCALAAVVGIALIVLFVSLPGLPFMLRVGPLSFLTGSAWDPGAGRYGVLPMIVGSLAVTFGALVIAVPLGIAVAIYLAEIAPKPVYEVTRLGLGVLAGIPSVVYGFYGLVVLVPLIREYLGGAGLSVLAGSLVLAVMVLPTITAVSEDSIKAVPNEYREGSIALGATKWETIRNVVIPAAGSGISASVVLGIGRAVGETMAVLMVTGNAVLFPRSPTDMARTLTGNIALEMAYAEGDHQRALFATGLVLLLFIMGLNLFGERVLSAVHRYKSKQVGR